MSWTSEADGRRWPFAVAAAALHLALFILAPRARPVTRAREDASGPIEVAFENAPAPYRGGTDTGGFRGVIGAVRTASHTAAVWGVPAPSTTTFEPTPEGTSSAQQQDTSPPLMLGPETLGLGGSHSFSMEIAKQTAPAPEESARVAENVHRMLSSPVHVDGPITNELERIARTGNEAPYVGRAVFTIRVDEVGLVVSADVVEASGDAQAWQEVAKHMLNALARKQVRIPRGARGVEMRVEVTANVVYPSGAQHPITGQLGGTPNPASGTVPVAGAGFDTSDIGAQKTRVVASRVLSETAF